MIRDEDDLEALSDEERVEDVTHDVDGRLLVRLDLLPDDRVLEHAELCALKLTRRLDRPASIHHQHQTPRQHLQLLRCSWHSSH